MLSGGQQAFAARGARPRAARRVCVKRPIDPLKNTERRSLILRWAKAPRPPLPP